MATVIKMYERFRGTFSVHQRPIRQKSYIRNSSDELKTRPQRDEEIKFGDYAPVYRYIHTYIHT